MASDSSQIIPFDSLPSSLPFYFWYSLFSFFLFVCFFQTGSHYVALAGLELVYTRPDCVDSLTLKFAFYIDFNIFFWVLIVLVIGLLVVVCVPYCQSWVGVGHIGIFIKLST